MKKFALVLALMLITTPALAHRKSTVVTKAEEKNNVAGAKLDLPNLVRLSDNWTLGAEGGKDIINNIFYDSDDRYVEADKGYFAYIKLTYNGSLIDLSKK